MSSKEMNRPLRVFDKILDGGLGRGNIGVLVSRHGTGKLAVMTTIAIDHAMNGVETLHAVYGKSIDEVRAYDDEVLECMIEPFDLRERAEIMARVERHKQIYVWRSGEFSVERLRTTMEFLKEHAQFTPGLVELQGWPDLNAVATEDIQALKNLAIEFDTEIWISGHTHRADCAENEIPPSVERLGDLISVVVALAPDGEKVDLSFLKTHSGLPHDSIHLQFNPRTMMIRWR